MILEHIAEREGKLLSFLRREMGISYGLVKRLKYQEALRVNGQLVHTNHPVRTGDTIAVTIREDVDGYAPETGDLSIIYEDEAVIVVDKPAGMIIHPTFNRVEGTLANRLLGYYRRTGQSSAVHFVSRLDRDTFGLVLAAKNAHVHTLLRAGQDAGRLVKTYRAVVFGQPPATSGTIRHPIARQSPTSLLRCVREDGKASISHYEVLETSKECALLSLRPETGRTHQLRVHCAYEGFPIVGDPQYGSDASKAFSCAYGYAGQQLCAASLAFVHPLSGLPIHVHSGYDVQLLRG